MQNENFEYSVKEVILSSSEVSVTTPPYSVERKKCETALSCTTECEYKKSDNDNFVIAFTNVDFSIIDTELESSQNDDDLETHFSVSIQYVVVFENKTKTRKKVIEEYYSIEALKIAWPYFTQDIDAYLCKSHYGAFYIPPFDKRYIKTALGSGLHFSQKSNGS